GFDNLKIVKVRLQEGVCPSVYGREAECLLPYQSELSKKIVHHAHAEGHGGPDATHLKARKWAFIVAGRKLCTEVMRKCHQCQLEKANLAEQLMGPAPLFTLQPAPPFTHVQCDLAGPFFTKCKAHPRGGAIKVWVLVTVDQACGAVNFQSVPGYAAGDVLLGLEKLVNRFGYPATIVSDSGPNICRAVSLLSSEAGHSMNHIQVDARAQHRNGRAEKAVHLMKRALYPEVNKLKNLTLQAFDVLLGRVEMLINSRPIGVRGTSLKDSDFITPNQILLYGKKEAVTSSNVQDVSPAELADHVQAVMDEFWRTYDFKVRQVMGRTAKWRNEEANLSPGDYVAFKEPNPLREKTWLKGVVDEVFHSKDDLVRSVIIRFNLEGKVHRKLMPVQKVLVLERSDS
ncbi:MAG: hypothetical protein AAGJ80_08825, partial [Cyanobacteria bacterium J06553_1]